MKTASAAKSGIDVAGLIRELESHPLYEELFDAPSLRIFMRSHVFAVWDFQSLLKALQRSVTCVEIPWLPTGDPEARRVVNEIVLDEESDEAPGGGHLSHYELYIRAMQEAGADTKPICTFLGDLRRGQHLDDTLERPELPRGVASFVRSTMTVANSGQTHRIAGAFAYGREEVIPAMFQRLVDRLVDVSPQRWSTFRYYLDRHIEHDSEKHGPGAKNVVALLCRTDSTLWAEAQDAARSALEERLRLWDETLKLVLAERGREGG